MNQANLNSNEEHWLLLLECATYKSLNANKIKIETGGIEFKMKPQTSAPSIEEIFLSSGNDSPAQEEESQDYDPKKKQKRSRSGTPKPTSNKASSGKQATTHQATAEKNKLKGVQNQVAASTFWNYVDGFFKAIDEGDLRFLEDETQASIIDPAPFLIPTLGKRYEQQWREMYGFVVHNRGRSFEDSLSAPDPVPNLLDRLQAILFDPNAVTPLTQNHPPLHLSQRISQQLAELGIPGVPSQDLCEDDPICEELRTCQAALRDQLIINGMRKQRLAKRLRQHLAMQEFYVLLLEMDKQIDASFQRRQRHAKKRKRVTFSNDPEDGSHGVSPELRKLLENRRKLVEAFRDVFPDQFNALLPQPISIICEDEKEVLGKQSFFLTLPETRIKGSTVPFFVPQK